MNRGFTFIETLVYMALLGILLTGAVLASYQILTGAYQLDAKNTAGEEGAFVLRKLNWSLLSASSIAITPSTLGVVRNGGTSADFRLTGSTIEMQENGGGYEPITTSNVDASSLSFTNIPSSGGAPQGVTATVVINGATFSITRYLRR